MNYFLYKLHQIVLTADEFSFELRYPFEISLLLQDMILIVSDKKIRVSNWARKFLDTYIVC